jgi:hypothetical protein
MNERLTVRSSSVLLSQITFSLCHLAHRRTEMMMQNGFITAVAIMLIAAMAMGIAIQDSYALPCLEGIADTCGGGSRSPGGESAWAGWWREMLR